MKNRIAHTTLPSSLPGIAHKFLGLKTLDGIIKNLRKTLQIEFEPTRLQESADQVQRLDCSYQKSRVVIPALMTRSSSTAYS